VPPKKCCFWHFLKNKKQKKAFQKLKQKQFYFRFEKLSFRKSFLNKIFVLIKFYFRFGNTFTFACKLKYFRFKNKNNFTFISKTLSCRKCFLNKNIFVFKKIYFRFGYAITFVSKTLRKTNRKKLHQFCGRGPCVPPSVEGQCFQLRRRDLQILLRRCLAPAARDRTARTCRSIWCLSLL